MPYFMRCSPNCPYDDCIIVTNLPPMAEGQGGNGEGQEGEQDDSDRSVSSPTSGRGRPADSSGSPSDSRDGESTPGDSQSEPGERGPMGHLPRPDERDGSERQQTSGQRPETPKPDSSPADDAGQGDPGKESGTQKDANGDGQSGDGSGGSENEGEGQSTDSQEGNTGDDSGREGSQPSFDLGYIPKYEAVFDYGIDVYEKPGGHGASGRKDAIPVVKSSIFEEKVQRDRVFEARLKNVMTDNAYDRRVRGRKRGKLDMKSLYKVPAKRDNVFTLKEARKNKHYNIMLLVDESGSMAGPKADLAAECAVFLAKSFEGINVNVAIIGFNEFITTRKTWDSIPDYDKIYEAIASMNYQHGYSENNDWDALNKAYQMFDSAPDGKNILIMMSDGEPASDRARFIDIHGKVEKAPKGTYRFAMYEKDEIRHLNALVREHDRTVTSVGIGIQEGGHQIPNHTVVRDLRQLKPTLIKELAHQIKRG